MNNFRETIKEQIESLPANMQYAITSFNWVDKVLEIGNKHRLQIDEIDSFFRETILVIIGNQSTDDYSVNLQRELGISKEKANELIADTNNEIFEELFRIAFDEYESEEETDPQTFNEVFEKEDNLPSHEEILAEIENPNNSVGPTKTLEKEKFEKISTTKDEVIDQSITKPKKIYDMDPYREEV